MSISEPQAPFPTITKQEVTRRYDSNGNHVKHWTIHLRHADGTESFIELPDGEYTPDNIKAFAQDEANRVMAVYNLTPAQHRQAPHPNQA